MTETTVTTTDEATTHATGTAPGSSPSSPDPSDGTAAASARTRRRRSTWIAWAIALVMTAVAVVSTVQWRDLADREAARDDVAAASAGFLVTLTTWDATDGLDDTRGALTEAGTADFRDEVEDLFGGELGAALEEAGAVSEGEISDVFVQRIAGDEAVVFAVVVQRVTAEGTEPTTTLRGARLTLHRQDGSWLVHEVELVQDGSVVGRSSS